MDKMKRELSPEFKDFMISLKAWVDAGCPDPTKEQKAKNIGFRKYDSICFQVSRWTEHIKVFHKIQADRAHLFSLQFENVDYPFNENAESYEFEMANASHYENPARLKWINDTVASFKAERTL